MPPETTAPPPAAPASKPTAAAPQPPAANAPPVQNIDDVYGEFDTIESKPAPSARKEPAQPKEPQAKPTTPPKAPATPPAPEPEPTTEPEPEKPAAPESKTEPPKPVRAAELRAAYENLKREHHQLKEQWEKARTQPQDDGRLKQMQELLDSERKARQDIEQELKFTAYEKSAEYKEKFERPYIQAYTLGRQKAASLKIAPKTDDLGEVVSPGRQGSEADFDAIMAISDDDLAAEKAVDLFGPKAQMILYYRERVQELHQAGRTALDDFRKNFSQREKEQMEARTRKDAEQEQFARSQAETFRKLVEEGVKAKPDWFNPVDGDDASAEILKRGTAVADSLFNGINPKTGRPYTPEGMVRFHAFVRNAVAAHGHLLHKLQLAQNKLTELESDLAEYKKSGSSQDSGRGAEKAPTGNGLAGDEEFDAAEARSNRRW